MIFMGLIGLTTVWAAAGHKGTEANILLETGKKHMVKVEFPTWVERLAHRMQEREVKRSLKAKPQRQHKRWNFMMKLGLVCLAVGIASLLVILVSVLWLPGIMDLFSESLISGLAGGLLGGILFLWIGIHWRRRH